MVKICQPWIVIILVVGYASFPGLTQGLHIPNSGLDVSRLSSRTPCIPKRSLVRCDHRHHSHDHHHGHHHDHHHDHHHHSLAAVAQKFIPSARTATRLAFSAFVTLFIPILVRYYCSSNRNTKLLPKSVEVMGFLVTSVVLGWADNVKRQVGNIIARFRRIGSQVVKHSHPEAFSARQFFLLEENDNAADRVTLIGVWINLLLSIGKFVVGVTCHSAALVADAGHSLSDLFSDGITLYAVQVGRLPPDDDHPYGHGKFEAIGSLFLALTLLMTGLGVGVNSNRQLMEIFQAQRTSATVLQQVPTSPALLMAGLSIFSKEWLYRITHKVGKQLNSQVVIANAWHHRSDAYSSVLALFSIALAMFVPGFLAADSAAGLLVAGMICMTGVDILEESIQQLTDTQLHEQDDLVQEIQSVALETSDDVMYVNHVRARQVGSQVMVDISIATDENLSSSATRNVEERVRWNTLQQTQNVLDVAVKATPKAVICPLLVAQQEVSASHSSHEWDDSQKNSESKDDADVVQQPMNSIPGAINIEEHVRQILAQEFEFPIEAVQGVTVHYEASVKVHVDVDVKFYSDRVKTLVDAQNWANRIQSVLCKEDLIDGAFVFLDLTPENENGSTLRRKKAKTMTTDDSSTTTSTPETGVSEDVIPTTMGLRP